MPDPVVARVLDGSSALPNVELIHWPAQEERRRLLAVLGEPRILLLARHCVPPTDVDDLEQWIPEGAEPSTIVEAITRLQRKVLDRDGLPVLDDDGLLWFRGRWTPVAESQIPVVDLLIRNYQRLVRHEVLGRAYLDGGGGPTMAARRALMHRIAGRFAKVGLKLHSVRRRGFILAADPTSTAPAGAWRAHGPQPPVPEHRSA